MTLRTIIRQIIKESWEDPSTVLYSLKHDFDPIVDDDIENDSMEDEDDTNWERKRDKLEKRAKHNKQLRDRDTFARANVSLYSMKPIAPKQPGGAQSGRTPGGRTVSTQGRVSAAGY
jgi:hypothetical protein